MSQRQGDKTEKATPKKRRDAREKGQVFKSQDTVVALSVMALVAVLAMTGSYIIGQTRAYLTRALTAPLPDTLTAGTVGAAFMDGVLSFFLAMLPLLAGALLAGLAANYLQVGFLFTPKGMMPKFSRVSMSEGFKRIFSQRTLIELVKSIVKISVLGYVAYSQYMAELEKAPQLMSADFLTSAAAVCEMIVAVALKMALALIIMAPFDFLYQWWKHEKDLMMTKQEVKDEYKLTEGDPQIKGRIRQKQREMSAMRMMEAVAGADVVITNPTHYAVALAYKEGVHTAPVVIAKGKDYLALKIRERAQELNIQRVENRQLAQQLYFFCEIGDEVPEEVYQTVAEILAYIYRLKRGIRGAYR